MENDFILYQKFTDLESAEEFASELNKNGIEYHLEDNNHSYVKVFGYTQIDIAFGVSIKEQDFSKAELVLETYYNEQIKGIDRSYYIFEFSDQELNEIISNPFDWGRLDYQLAKHILKERGLEVSDYEIRSIKTEKIIELSQKEKASNIKIICGYILAVIIPYFGIFMGLTIKYNRKILPTGEKFYINTDQDRKHGQKIIMISVISFCLFFLYFFYLKH
ncbi:MAG: hypothetical protein WCJ85_00005 [Chitinophagaceae bacterium]